MNLAEQDLFEVWRTILCVLCTIYALVVMGQSLWSWLVFFAGDDRRTAMLRSYALVQLLRLRPRRFSWEFLQIGAWLVVLALLLNWHRI